MKVKETIERDCCQNRDLVEFPHQPRSPGRHRFYFCRYCGRPWTTESYMDAAGGTDTRNVPLPWPWEAEDKPPVTNGGQWVAEHTDRGWEVLWNLTRASGCSWLFPNKATPDQWERWAKDMAESLNAAMQPK